MEKKKAILFDIDGVLTRLEITRSKPVPPTEFQKFYNRIPFDKLNVWARELVNAMIQQGYEVILMTGRHERTRKATETWVKDKCGWDAKDYTLVMRPENDQRQDRRVKRDLYKRHVRPKYKILFVVEDRKSVVKMWRKLKLVVLQNSEGNY